MKLSHPLRSKFLKANATLGAPTLVRLLAGAVKSKTSALLLGTTGVGVVGIGAQLQNLGVTCASMGVSSSLIREMSRFVAQKDEAGKKELLGTSFTLQLLTNLPLLALGLLFIKPLARFTFGDKESFVYLIPIFLAIPVQSVMSAHLSAVFYAHGKLRPLAHASIAAALIEAAAYILLVRIFGVTGAFWGLATGMAAWFTLLAIFANQLEPWGNLFGLTLNKKYLGSLLGTGAVMTLAGAVTYAANAMIRIKIMRTLGGSSAGIYQVVQALTAYYLPYFTNGVWGRLFPKISASGLSSEGQYEWSEALVLTSILSGGVQVTLMAAAGVLVSLFYSHEFAGAVPLTAIQFAGDLFYLISIPCMGVLMGLGRMRWYAAIWLGYYVLFYVAATLLTDRLGLQGTVLGYFLSNLALSLVCIGFYAKKLRGSRHLGPTLAAIGASAAAVLIQGLICFQSQNVAYKLVMPLLWGSVGAAVLLSSHAKKRLLIHGYAEVAK